MEVLAVWVGRRQQSCIRNLEEGSKGDEYRGREMIIDQVDRARQLAPIRDNPLPYFNGETFFYFLRRELARAERYRSFVSLLLFKVETASRLKADSVPLQLAQLLDSLLRETDYMGRLGDATLGIILLNSKRENTRKILQRLTAEALDFTLGRYTEAKLRTADVVFPSDANSLQDLLTLAGHRLDARPSVKSSAPPWVWDGYESKAP
ncbi:MAG: diguanylate cyclase domain-containing protein [Acidobacteriota bacterium]